MAIEIKQQLRLSQQLVMTPQLQQAIKLLQLSRLELADLVQQELQENVVLEESVEGAEDLPREVVADSEEAPTPSSEENSDVPENRITLCAFHHQRCLHAGRLRIRGRAPDELVFELGLRPADLPPLARYRSGDILLPEPAALDHPIHTGRAA